MEAVVVVVYDRLGKVRFRQRLATLPATVGRSAACDIILDDRQVSAVHARLEQDPIGRVVLRDLGSKNGLRLGHDRVQEVVFPAARAVVVGATRLGVFHPSDAVERTEVRRLSVLDRNWIALPALLLAVGAEGLLGWLNADELKALKLIADEVLPVVLGISVWALAWAIATRIAHGVFRYLAHWTIAALAFGVARWLRVAAVPAVGFWGSMTPGQLRMTSDLLTLFVGTWLVAQHLRRTGSWSLKRCYAIAAGLMLAIGIPAELTQLAKADDFDTDISVPREALPTTLGRGASIRDFVDHTEALQRDVDQQRHRK